MDARDGHHACFDVVACMCSVKEHLFLYGGCHNRLRIFEPLSSTTRPFHFRENTICFMVLGVRTRYQSKGAQYDWKSWISLCGRL